MGQEILYCLVCGTRLRGQDFDRGQAFRIDDLAYCCGCTSIALKSLPPDKVARLLKEIATSGARRDNRLPRTRALPAVPPGPPSTSRVQTGVSSRTVIAGAVGGVVVLVTGLLFIGIAGGPPTASSGVRPDRDSGRTEKPNAFPRESTEQAADPGSVRLKEEARRRMEAEGSLRKAREIARTRPEDFAAQLPLYELALRTAQGTSLQADAERELQGVRAALQAAARPEERLFNGADLRGWEQRRGLSTVRDGAIHVNCGEDANSRSLLETSGVYSHYDFSCRVRGIRTQYDRLYFELLVHNDARIIPGGLDTNGGWHDLKIRARGANVEVWLDEKRLAPREENKNIASGSISVYVNRGVFAMKDVVLKRLD